MPKGMFDYLEIEEVMETHWVDEELDVESCNKIVWAYKNGLLDQDEYIRSLYGYYHSKYPDNLGDVYYFKYGIDYLGDEGLE